MKTQIHFTRMERSENLESYVSEKLISSIEEDYQREGCHLQVWLVNEHSKTQKGKPEYRCEVSLRFPPKKEVFINKSSEDMYDAINIASSALQQVLREQNKKMNSKR